MNYFTFQSDVNTVTFANESGDLIYSGSDDNLCKVACTYKLLCLIIYDWVAFRLIHNLKHMKREVFLCCNLQFLKDRIHWFWMILCEVEWQMTCHDSWQKKECLKYQETNDAFGNILTKFALFVQYYPLKITFLNVCYTYVYIEQFSKCCGGISLLLSQHFV
jgi:hypothetical protein